MTCQHCEKDIPIHRILRDREYCCAEHRLAHQNELNRLGLALLMEQPPRPNADSAVIPRLAGVLADALQTAARACLPDSTKSSSPQFPASVSLDGPGRNLHPAVTVPATAQPAKPALVQTAREPKP